MFCPKCGREIAESQAFCRFCGTSLTYAKSEPKPQPKREPRRRPSLWLWILGILVAFLIWRIFLSPPEQETQSSVANTEQGAPSQASDAGQSQTTEPSASEPPTYDTGQQFSIGYWSYSCHDAYWTPVLGVFDPYSAEHANGEFIVVDITAQNNDTSSSTVPPFQLRDQEGRTYDESSAGMLRRGFFSGLEQLNPGVAERGSVAFDVPPDRQYVLVVSGGIESGKTAIVTLPMSRPQSDQKSAPVDGAGTPP